MKTFHFQMFNSGFLEFKNGCGVSLIEYEIFQLVGWRGNCIGAGVLNFIMGFSKSIA